MEETDKSFVVGITGGSASGKTFFAEKLTASLPEHAVCRISQDNYYRPIHEIPKDKNGVENFDLPDTIDHMLFAEHLAALRRGEVVEKGEYTFNNPDAQSRLLYFYPRRIIVAEGLFVYHSPDVAAQIDLKIFVDAEEEVKIKRRISRDNVERGYGLSDVLYRWENHVTPAYDRFIVPMREAADIVVNNNTNFGVALDVIQLYLRSKIRREEQ